MKTAARRTERAAHARVSAWSRVGLALVAGSLWLGLDACTGPGLDPPMNNRNANGMPKASKDAGSAPRNEAHDGKGPDNGVVGPPATTGSGGRGAGTGGAMTIGPADAGALTPNVDDEDAGVVR